MKSTTSSILFALLFAFATLVPLSMQAAVFGNETTGTSTYPGTTFERVGFIATGTDSNYIESIAVDPSGDFAYYALGGADPNTLVKVDMSDFSITEELTLSAGDTSIQTSAMDPDGSHVYFVTSTNRLIKIDLSDFSRADALALPVGSQVSGGMAIDSAGDFAYITKVSLASTTVHKVNLSTFSLTGTLEVDAWASANEGARAIVIDPTDGFAYVPTARATTNLTKIIKIDLSDFTTTTILELDAADVNPRTALIDPDGDFAYFSGSANIVKVNLSTFTRVGAVIPNDGGALGFFNYGFMDPAGSYAYFAADGTPVKVAQIDLSDFTHSDTVTLAAEEDDMYAAVISPLGDFGYISTTDYSTAPRVVKVALPTLPATFPQGYVLASEVTLTEEADIESISLHSHTATGTVRLALYNSTLDLVWESGAVTNDATDDVVTALISAGTPTTLTGLAAGTYYLAFQIEGSDAVPSFTEGASGDGLRLTQSYAAFPADLDAATDTTQTWTIYATYSVPVEEVVEEEEEEESSGSTSSHRRSGGGGGSSSDDDDDSSGSSSAEIETLMQQLLDLLTVYLELLMKQRGL